MSDADAVPVDNPDLPDDPEPVAPGLANVDHPPLPDVDPDAAPLPVDGEFPARAEPDAGLVPSDTAGCDISPVTHSDLPRLPKDHLNLTQFRGDSDLSHCTDVLFGLVLYIDATPSLAGAVTTPASRRAMSTPLATILGCFPPESVAAVWFRNAYRQNVFTSLRTFCVLFREQFEQSTSDLVALQNRWQDAHQHKTQS